MKKTWRWTWGSYTLETDHDEDRNPKASNTFITKLGKRKKARADSGDETSTKKPLFHKYKIDMEVLRYAVETNHVDLLPPGGFVGENFTSSNLIALVYFLREGSLLNQEWYSEGFVPDPKLYLPEAYGIWKVLSTKISLLAKHRKPLMQYPSG